MEFEEFEKVVNEILKDIPEEYRQVLRDERIEVICREYVPMGVRQQFPGKIVFGLFAGISKNKKTTLSVQVQPTRIEIYKESFEIVFGRKMTGEMKGQIYRTLVHEIAHYFGFNEEEVRFRGY
ncbi:metallopeptidase family protein [candidate division WOR-3 bacterium]|nr:metallopeptidase family protein [candidate division WOR-3 bacterium]